MSQDFKYNAVLSMLSKCSFLLRCSSSKTANKSRSSGNNKAVSLFTWAEATGILRESELPRYKMPCSMPIISKPQKNSAAAAGEIKWWPGPGRTRRAHSFIYMPGGG